MPKAKSIRVATPYATLEEFIVGYWRYCDAEGCFVPTLQRRPVGMAASFSVELAGGTVVMEGTCVVKAAYCVEDSPFGKAGVLLGIKKLKGKGEAMYERLLAEREKTVPNAIEPEDSARPTEAMEPLKAMAMISFGGVVSVRVPTEVPEECDDGLTVPNPLPSGSQPLPKVKAEAKSTILGFAPLRMPRPVAAPIAPLEVGEVTLTVVPLGMPGRSVFARAWRWVRRLFATSSFDA